MVLLHCAALTCVHVAQWYGRLGGGVRVCAGKRVGPPGDDTYHLACRAAAGEGGEQGDAHEQ